MILQHYLGGQWLDGTGAATALLDPVTGAELATVAGGGLDLAAALDHARRVGGPALKSMTYAERGALLKAVAEVLTANRDRYNDLSLQNSGATAVDCAFDVDGGIGTLRYFAGLGKSLGDTRHLVEPDMERLGRDESFQTLHLWAPYGGVAIHINAFNFPSWGLWGKVAVALLSGMPVLAKPAAATALLSHAMVKDVIEAGVLPDGALSLLCAGGRDLMDLVRPQDVVSFTGSADTARRLRANPTVIAAGVPFNIEADSLNAAVLGPDAAPGSDEFAAFVKEVLKEMTVKAGQKCTAIRRILVPAERLDAVQEALTAKLAGVVVGDPRQEGVRMGPLVNRAQVQAAEEGLARLTQDARVVFESDVPRDGAGCFFPATLLRCDDPDGAEAVHAHEVFGPVATLMPYRDADHAFALVARGEGSLVTSVFTADADFAARASVALAAVNGRVAVVDGSVAKANPGHGVVMPQCLHGGPGRAGGGEEMGGRRALRFYHQRCAIQGSVAHLTRLKETGASFTG